MWSFISGTGRPIQTVRKPRRKPKNFPEKNVIWRLNGLRNCRSSSPALRQNQTFDPSTNWKQSRRKSPGFFLSIRKLPWLRHFYLTLFAPLPDLLLPAPLTKNAVVVYLPFAVFTNHRFYFPSWASLTAVQSLFAAPGISAPLPVKCAYTPLFCLWQHKAQQTLPPLYTPPYCNSSRYFDHKR